MSTLRMRSKWQKVCDKVYMHVYDKYQGAGGKCLQLTWIQK